MCKHGRVNAVVILVLSVMAASLHGSLSSYAYDRTWWKSAVPDEKVQFIAGYLDCSAYDIGKASLADAQWGVIAPKVTQYYASHPGQEAQTVPSLILHFANSSRSTDPAPELHAETHGIFDGDYWRQISPSGRVGFVEGYVVCHDSASTQRKFAIHSARWYVDQISNAYGMTPEGDIDDRDIPKKIGTIINSLIK